MNDFFFIFDEYFYLKEYVNVKVIRKILTYVFCAKSV